MEVWEIIKDIVVILTPCIVAIITHIGNKKTKKDIQLELEKNLKEKGADIEGQKALSSWNNSMPQVNEYTKLVGIERYGNIGGLPFLIQNLRNYINENTLTIDELLEIKNLLFKINIPKDEEHLFPYEIPSIIEYNKLIREIEKMISTKSNQS